MKRAELIISGQVQGVFYRGSAQQEALRLGLTGQVRNLRDGSVEAVVEGPTDRIEAFVTWCRRGPPASQVDDVQVRWSAGTGEFESFKVAR